MNDLEDVEAARRGAEWQRSRDVAELERLTTQLREAVSAANANAAEGLQYKAERDAAQAIIAEALDVKPVGLAHWAIRRILNHADTSALDAAIMAAKLEAWDEGFDAGERDAMGHETFDEPCIPNPYRVSAGVPE